MTINHSRLFVSCPKSMEYLLEDEIKIIWDQRSKAGKADATWAYKTSPLGVSVECDQAFALTLCLWSRIANRVFYQLCETRCHSVEQLYDAVYSIDWLSHLGENAVIAVDFSGQSSFVRNTVFGTQKVKDAIVDHVRDKTGTRPSVNADNPDIRIRAHLRKGIVAIYIDMAGSSLHQRGYRSESGRAPMKENLAAGILQRCQFQQLLERCNQTGFAVVDPMCGSGTLLIEAALIACDRAPGLLRRNWGFQRWRQFDTGTWSTLVQDAESRFLIGKEKVTAGFYGYDVDRKVLASAKRNAERAGVDDLLHLVQRDIRKFKRPAKVTSALVVSNPPYGERLGALAELGELYGVLGNTVQSAFSAGEGDASNLGSRPQSRLAVFSSNPQLIKNLGIRVEKKYKFLNGTIPCELVVSSLSDANQLFQADNAFVRGANWRIANPERAAMFGNRLQKNRKSLAKWLKREGISCYRLYDSDMPEYAVAIDVYDSWYHVQEYVAPKTIDPQSARERFMEALAMVRDTFGVAPDRIVYKRRERQKGLNQYQKLEFDSERIEVSEYNARFYIKLGSYLDTGLFLDHRPIRKWLGQNSAQKRVLNLYCYTGSVSVYAALGGANEVVSVDMSNTYLNWAKDNFRLNRLSIDRHGFVRADCFQWLKQCKEKFDLVFLDPPTFSNSKRMAGNLDIQRDHVALINLCVRRLRPGGVLLFSNNLRKFKMDWQSLSGLLIDDISKQTIDPDFNRNNRVHHCWKITRPD
ncbi:MAG: bifunctional 23S rRNA (guanine(2069)-N(7))-methyltransferase RlmK/23S rRNA (guanine(2445)-N(2))-methyltransferase RlmL [Gammaproteobacteria bacterium]|nr:MAG: bifunctional 23S rRNA (guanine(2069)-N(7))-methyltransferase RlmK/23S rRNA (guanine(2445)-N(2))-methyltransferase RlmL [Gammaproteobacteria bacterium]